MYKYILLVAFLPALALAQTPVRQCPNGPPLPPFVDINGCTSLPCEIRSASPIEALARGIVSPISTPTLTAYINIMLGGINIPFPMPDGLDDACRNGVASGTCPVSAGQTFDYTLRHGGMPLSITGVVVQVEVGLRAQNGQLVGCLQFDARILP
ncbi:NPC intracellular cholesterol transporter 2-like [Toxorhynchites rutilus septentrionalis]|uniref:NPC intracellular cholesterol transporter 2-like n=1 Tax=Toxorhynchites rutilus septentrionalis TaxID=329112 RepID=UPI0024796FD1|nr:NPC intracellular cholesterol transporter 2-like [Toxorhynchites rutilus septentrionalis]